MHIVYSNAGLGPGVFSDQRTFARVTTLPTGRSSFRSWDAKRDCSPVDNDDEAFDLSDRLAFLLKTGKGTPTGFGSNRLRCRTR